jgi:hypothetical protein
VFALALNSRVMPCLVRQLCLAKLACVTTLYQTDSWVVGMIALSITGMA